MVAIILLGNNGEPLARLRFNAIELIEEAEALARERDLSKAECLPIVLREHIEQDGYGVAEAEIVRRRAVGSGPAGEEGAGDRSEGFQ